MSSIKIPIYYKLYKKGGTPKDNQCERDNETLDCQFNGKLNEILPKAIDFGYRHFDGANGYTGPGYYEMLKSIFDMKVNGRRNEFWITWKGDDITEQKVESVINKLNCGYIDLYLVHHGCGIETDFIELKKLKARSPRPEGVMSS